MLVPTVLFLFSPPATIQYMSNFTASCSWSYTVEEHRHNRRRMFSKHVTRSTHSYRGMQWHDKSINLAVHVLRSLCNATLVLRGGI